MQYHLLVVQNVRIPIRLHSPIASAICFWQGDWLKGILLQCQTYHTPVFLSSSFWRICLSSQSFWISGSRCTALAFMLKLVCGKSTVSLYCPPSWTLPTAPRAKETNDWQREPHRKTYMTVFSFMTKARIIGILALTFCSFLGGHERTSGSSFGAGVDDDGSITACEEDSLIAPGPEGYTARIHTRKKSESWGEVAQSVQQLQMIHAGSNSSSSSSSSCSSTRRCDCGRACAHCRTEHRGHRHSSCSPQEIPGHPFPTIKLLPPRTPPIRCNPTRPDPVEPFGPALPGRPHVLQQRIERHSWEQNENMGNGYENRVQNFENFPRTSFELEEQDWEWESERVNF